MRTKTDATFGQAAQCLAMLSQQGLTSVQMQLLFDGGYLASVARAAKYGMLPSSEMFQQMLGVEEEFIFTLDFNRTWEDLLDECDFSSVADACRRTNFNIQGEGVVCYAARFLELRMNPKRAVSYLNGAEASPSWELGRIEHALGFLAEFPGYKRSFVTPGSTITVLHQNRNFMPMFIREDKQRKLDLSWWDVCHRALVVKPLRKIA
ncbi:hypothetical protein K2Q08_03500 [Patescibacteria group bacterium]|nr:hypothetical protein [Patescibacteria group bacterium]